MRKKLRWNENFFLSLQRNNDNGNLNDNANGNGNGNGNDNLNHNHDDETQRRTDHSGIPQGRQPGDTTVFLRILPRGLSYVRQEIRPQQQGEPGLHVARTPVCHLPDGTRLETAGRPLALGEAAHMDGERVPIHRARRAEVVQEGIWHHHLRRLPEIVRHESGLAPELQRGGSGTVRHDEAGPHVENHPADAAGERLQG